MQRVIEKIINAQAARDGDGVKISRSIGAHFLPEIDPFLLLDELNSDEAADYIGGFPSHPHRGFETVTYMLAGQMRHKDSAGNEGVVGTGDLQWMTAGSGIIHSEMPEQQDGQLWGFQLWINLPAEQKMRAPRYQEIASANIPEMIFPEGKVRVLAGEINNADNTVVTGAAKDIATNPMLLDVQLNASPEQPGQWEGAITENHTAVVYIYRGQLTIGNKEIKAQQLAVLSKGDMLKLTTTTSVGALVLAAEPINEPIVRSGPFVMNTQQELMQAFNDYRSGNFLRKAV